MGLAAEKAAEAAATAAATAAMVVVRCGGSRRALPSAPPAGSRMEQQITPCHSFTQGSPVSQRSLLDQPSPPLRRRRQVQRRSETAAVLVAVAKGVGLMAAAARRVV